MESKKRKARGISGIFFDLGGTLIHPDPRRIAEVFLTVTGEKTLPEAWVAAIQRATVSMDERLGKGFPFSQNWWLDYFGDAVCNLGIGKFPQESLETFAFALKEEHLRENLWSRVSEGAVGLLSRLKSKGFFLGVISNSDGRVQKQLAQLGLARFFEFALDSQVVEVEKPDPRIFRMGLEKSGLNASQVVYIGDFVHFDVNGSRKVGMECLLIDPLEARREKGRNCIKDLTGIEPWLEKRTCGSVQGNPPDSDQGFAKPGDVQPKGFSRQPSEV